MELALDKSTGQQVAIKFIERGDKVWLDRFSKLGPMSCCRADIVIAMLQQQHVPPVAPTSFQSMLRLRNISFALELHVIADYQVCGA